MKNTLIFSVILVAILISCGPAAEDRQLMHQRAKVFQDSIATFIKTAMDEAATPGPNAQPAAAPQPTAAAPAPTAQPTQPANPNPNIGVNKTK